MDVWVSHLTSFQHLLGVTAIQVTVSPPAWSLELSLHEGQISGNAHEVIGTTAGKWGHADKVLAECGRCSYSVKHVEVYFASQADQLAPVHKTDLSFILFSTEGPSLWFSRENQCQRHSSSSAVSSMHLLLASSTEEENHLKGRAGEPLFCCLLAGPHVGICCSRSWLQSQPGSTNSAPSTDCQPPDKVLCVPNIFTKI